MVVPVAPSPPGETLDPALLRLRPRDVAGLFDQAVWLYRRNFRVFLSIAAVIQLPALLLVTLISTWVLSDFAAVMPQAFNSDVPFDQREAAINSLSDTLARFSAVSFISLLQAILLAVAEGALARAIADRYLGRPATFRGTYRAIRPQIIWLVLFILIQLPLSYLVLIPPLYIYVLVALSFVPQVIVLENANVITAMQRSWRLVQGQWWRTAGMNLLALLIRGIIVLPTTIITPLLLFLGTPATLYLFLSQFATITLTVVYLPAQLGAITLLYYDLRIRKEAYDLEMALAEHRATLPVPPAPAAPSPDGYTMTGPERSRDLLAAAPHQDWQ